MKWLILIWTFFTAALAIWWWILGLRLVQANKEIPGVDLSQLDVMHRMFMTEGSFLVLMIILGGAALGVSIWKIRQKNQQMREFFASFTHEIKTSLTNLRMQTELMQEDPQISRSSSALKRLLHESTRLELQLENSLWIAQGDSARIFPEALDLRVFLTSLSSNWHGLELELVAPAGLNIKTDRRGLEIIFRNLFQNASIHGEARKVRVAVSESSTGLEFRVSNDGKAFSGEASILGKMFSRQSPSSGTGVGLALVKTVMERLNGRTNFIVTPQKQLEVILLFPRGENL